MPPCCLALLTTTRYRESVAKRRRLAEEMPCSLLHVLEQPDPAPYADPDLKDLVGYFPRCSCTRCTPPRLLAPGEVVRCLDREAPCWKPDDRICG